MIVDSRVQGRRSGRWIVLETLYAGDCALLFDAHLHDTHLFAGRRFTVCYNGRC